MTTTVHRERVILTDSFDLPLASRVAFRLFTARGERLWVPGWSPEFFADVVDDLDIGTVFRTHDGSHRPTTWVVVDCELGHRVRYARVVDGRNAGTVEVTLQDIDNGCRIGVVYDLTSTDPDSDALLRLFTDEYASFIRSWAEMIMTHLDAGGALPDSV